MRVLFVSPYIYAPQYEEHSKNKTGFGMMVYDIASSIAHKGNEVLAVVNTFCKNRKCNGFVIAKHTLLSTLIHGHYCGLLKTNCNLKRNNIERSKRIRYLFYYMNIGYIEYVIKKYKPEMVHIHGIEVYTNRLIGFLKRNGIPFVVTLHGLLQNDEFPCSFEKEIEKEFIKECSLKHIPVTVISSKMKERFLGEYYGVADVRNVSVITNGTSKQKEVVCEGEDKREKYCLPKECKIVLVIGSLCERKNQSQVVKAIELIPREQRKKLCVFFLGRDMTDGLIQREIEKSGTEDTIKVIGFVPQTELSSYYEQADLNIVASIDEGFGLSIIEGFIHGVPTLCFSDLDAVDDLYDEQAMLLCDDRDVKAFSDSILLGIEKKWDKEKIINHGEKFSLDKMSERYIEKYREIIAGMK